jgi:hypothetical protein
MQRRGKSFQNSSRKKRNRLTHFYREIATVRLTLDTRASDDPAQPSAKHQDDDDQAPYTEAYISPPGVSIRGIHSTKVGQKRPAVETPLEKFPGFVVFFCPEWLLKQDGNAFLCEVIIVRQDAGDNCLSHRLPRHAMVSPEPPQ